LKICCGHPEQGDERRLKSTGTERRATIECIVCCCHHNVDFKQVSSVLIVSQAVLILLFFRLGSKALDELLPFVRRIRTVLTAEGNQRNATGSIA
jgi:hypothetical protein